MKSVFFNVCRSVRFYRLVIASFIILWSLCNSTVVAQEKTIATGLEVVTFVGKANEVAAEKIVKIEAAYNYVESHDAYKTLVDGKALEFPYAIVKDGEDKSYAIIVNNVFLDPVRGMRAEILMKIKVSSEKHLYFMADNVPLSKSGKLIGEMNLFLVKTDSFQVGKGYNLIFKGLDNPNKAYSFVTFDCKGFKEIFINGKLKFDPSSVVEANDGNSTKKPLALDFFINADKLTNFVLEFKNVPSFEFTSLPGFKCTVPHMVLDYSDKRNAPDFALPGWYLDSLSVKVPGLDKTVYGSQLWKGVYIPKIVIEIPKEFENDKPNGVATITSDHLIVDQHGITALVQAVSVLNGDLKGFKYSVDSLRLNVIANTLSKAGFYGGMSFPICKEDSKMAYGLTISSSISNPSDLTYVGYARLKTNLNVQAFGLAQIGLTKCDIDFVYRNKQFFPKVTLDGSLMVAPSSKNDSTPAGNFGVTVTSLVLSSEAPYIEKGPGFTMLVKGDLSSKLASLPVTIKDPDFRSSSDKQRFGLGFTLAVNLQKSNGEDSKSSNGFSGDATVMIWTKRNASTKRWSYDDFEVSAINLKADIGAVKAEGSLTMFNGDKVYGKGFCGSLKIEIIEKIKVEGAAIFGRVTDQQEPSTNTAYSVIEKGGTLTFPSTDETQTVSTGNTMYRYWFMDSKISFTPGIPIGTGIEINSFTGGIYYNMEMKRGVQKDSSGNAECKTVSGRTYIPSKGILGLLAGIGLQSAGGGTAFNGDINFGIEFNIENGFGVRQIATWGGVKFMDLDFAPSGLDKLSENMSATSLGDDTKDNTNNETPPDASLAANWFVSYDFPNKTLVGDFDVYVNLVGVLNGNQGGNKAGRISVYSCNAPGKESEWYLYIGKPIYKEMFGVSILSLVDIEGYFCIGSVLPTPPIAPMPPEIGADIDIDYNLLAMGGGMSFGARLSADGDPGLDLWPCDLAVKFEYVVMAGFDLLISQSVKDIPCSEAKKGVRGINRWYSTGQSYFYGGAALKVKYDCTLFGSDNFDLFSMYLKAYVFAQIPNPSYFKGKIDVGFSVIGKTFHEDFKLELGKICSSAALETNVNFIERIDPANGNTEIATGSPIQVYFSKPLEEFTYTIVTGSKDDVFRAKIEKSGIKVSSPKGNIDFTYSLNKQKDQLTITPIRVMPGGSEITVEITLITQVQNDKSWRNTDKKEIQEVKFTTTEEPNYIPVPDVEYAYPLPGMKNFYINETRNGYVQLSVLPNKAVQLVPGYEFNLGIFEGSNEIDRTSSIKYEDNWGKHNFTFDIPNVRLAKNKTYTLKILKSPVKDPTQQSQTQNNNITMGTLASNLKDTVILQYDFTTSSSLTFVAKMSSMNTSFAEIFNGIIASELTINNTNTLNGNSVEALSEFETNGFIKSGQRTCLPLVQFGDLSYSNESLNSIQNIMGDISSVSLSLRNSGKAGKYTAVTSLISDINSFLKDVNMQCLLKGNQCSADQKFEIPKGKFNLPLGYYLPGETTPSSVYNIAINLDENLILPQ